MSDIAAGELEEIRKRAEAATAGPWTRAGVRRKLGPESCIIVGTAEGSIIFLPIGSQQGDKFHAAAFKDAEFIAHARTDIPKLLAYIASLEGRMEADNEIIRNTNEARNNLITALSIAELRAHNAAIRQAAKVGDRLREAAPSKGYHYDTGYDDACNEYSAAKLALLRDEKEKG